MKIIQLQKGSILVDVSVAVQTMAPDGLMQKIHERTLHSLQQKYNIQDLQITKGNPPHINASITAKLLQFLKPKL